MPAPIAPRPLAPPIPKGMVFVRAAIAKSLHPEPETAVHFAAQRWGKDSAPVSVIKSATGAASRDDGVVGINGAATEFMSAVFEQSAMGKLALRRRPPKTRFLIPNGLARGSFVGEGQSVPVLPYSFTGATMSLKKVASIIVATKELLRSADPVAEVGIRNDLIAATALALDEAFFDPNNAGDSATPASITNGLAPVLIGSGDPVEVAEALADVIEGFQGDLTRAVWIARPETFALFHSMGYRDIGLRGGTLVGGPAVATRGLPIVSGLYPLILVDPLTISFAADPSGTEITTSENAALQMSTAPTNDSVTPTPTTLVSLFQANAVAIRALAYAAWEVEQPGVSLVYTFPRVAS